MKITAELPHADLDKMGVTKEQLEQALTRAVEGGLDIDGETLYINGADVAVEVSGSPSGLSAEQLQRTH